jgi:hypothetical protein
MVRERMNVSSYGGLGIGLGIRLEGVANCSRRALLRGKIPRISSATLAEIKVGTGRGRVTRNACGVLRGPPQGPPVLHIRHSQGAADPEIAPQRFLGDPGPSAKPTNSFHLPSFMEF